MVVLPKAAQCRTASNAKATIMSNYLHSQFQSSGFKGMTKRQMSALIAAYTNRFLREGNQIKVCRPAFAVGCEMRPSVMQAIRRGR